MISVAVRRVTLGLVSTSEQLFQQWAEGDARAGSELFDRHFAELFRFFRNKAPEAVEDLIQETFLACVRSRATFRGDASFRTYVFTIARHELYAHFERTRRRVGDTELGSLSVADLGTSPSLALVKRRDLNLLLRALRALPLDLQVALELHYFEELDGPDIAAILGVPEGTVRSRLRRAKDIMRETLATAAAPGDEEALSASQSDLDGWARGVKDAFDDRE